jgi:filamentous hemagglutinin family protein
MNKFLIGGVFASSGDRALAQIVPDKTLGDKRSVVTPFPYLPIDLIEGGAIRGANLFHSFREFNVDSGGSAYFITPPGIENILSRVTGGSRSEILGTLGVVESANLFLINPNGIIFGRDASLFVGGSFVATTANAIGFGNQGFFSASTPDVVPVLTVNPSALLFNQIANQPITNQSLAGLQIPANQSLLLVGGDVNLEGGQLSAQGGRVELGGLAGAGTVGLDNNLHLSYPEEVQRADVTLNNGARVSTSGAGGDIEVQGRRVTLTDGSYIVTNNLGSQPGGTLTVTASESVEVSGDGKVLSGLFTQTQEGTGAAGDLTIKTGRLIAQNGAVVSASTFGSGQGGTLTVNASDSVELSGTGTLAEGKQVPSGLFTQTEGAVAAGDLTIETGRLIVRDGAQVSVSTRGEGAAGSSQRIVVIRSESP